MITWIFYAWAAQTWLWIPAFLGDFEAWFWYVKSMRDLLPPAVANESEMYFNRQNGIIMSYRNSSYYPAPTNWTTFPDEDEDNSTVNISKIVPKVQSQAPFHELDFTSEI